MKNTLRSLLACFLLALSLPLLAQRDCTDSLAYVPNSAEFGVASLSSSDSAVNFRVVNVSSTYYVYPMGRVMPVTALPPGMSPTQAWGWHVFQSSWNPGDTADVSTNFTVNQPIPANYMVDFEIWINYNEPLQDSCKFPILITLNLNPQTATGLPSPKASPHRIYPNPSNGSFRIDMPGTYTKVVVRDLHGRTISEFGPGLRVLDLPGLAPGRYFVTIVEPDGQVTLPLNRF